MSLSDDKQAGIFDVFNSTSKYFDGNYIVWQYGKSNIPLKLQLNKANTSDTKASISDFNLIICICPFLMILFLPKFTIHVTILILILSVSHY